MGIYCFILPVCTEISICHSIKQILAFNHSVKVGKLALLSQMVCLLQQLLFCVTSQCKTMITSVVYRPVVG